jgi:hypothetical protein
MRDRQCATRRSPPSGTVYRCRDAQVFCRSHSPERLHNEVSAYTDMPDPITSPRCVTTQLTTLHVSVPFHGDDNSVLEHH